MKTKRNRLFYPVLASCVGIIILLAGCQAGLFGKLVNSPESGPTEIQMGIPGGAGAKSITYASGDTAYVKVFNSSRAHQVIGSGSSYEVALTWDSGISKWKGSLDLSAISGDITVLAYVLNSSSQQIYRGSTTKTIDDSNRTTAISLTAATSYSLGDIGPSGGWIYFDKGSYSNSWRYLEAANADLSASWSGIALDTGYTLNATTGNVELSGVVQMYATDWYWGPNTNPLNTVATRGQGDENTVKLVTADGVSGVTPKVKKGHGRPAVSGTDVTRRKVATTTDTLSINGKADWFIPSSEELADMYTNIRSVSGTGLTGMYWSSTEDTTLTAGAYSGKYIDFSTGSTLVDERIILHKVRPSRRF